MRISKAVALLTGMLALLLVSEPLQAKKAKPVKDTVNFFSFNDFHGSFQQTGNIPGAGRLVKTLQLLKATQPNACVLAGGDNYSGGYFPRLTGGKPLDKVFEYAGVEYSAIGNHEFDWGIAAMEERLNWGKTRYLAANIFTDSLRGIRPPWATPYIIKHWKLKNGTPVRIAFIGLSTQETKTAALPSIVKDLDFANPARMAALCMEQLKDSADLYILLTHIGTDMKDGEVVFTDANVDGLTQIAGVDGIFSGHSHKEVFGLLNGVPVIQARNYGRKIAHLQYELSRDRKGKVSSRFLKGELIAPKEESLAEMDTLIEEYLNDPEYGFKRILTRNLQTLDPEDVVADSRFSRLGALVTMAYQDCYRRLTGNDSSLVIGVCNAGAIRSTLPKGEITQLQAGSIIPFGGVLGAFEMSGKQLMELLQYGIECKAGWLQYHNMEISLRQNRITSACYVEGNRREPIEENGSYIIITENFVASGGDGYNPEWFRKKNETFEAIPSEQRNPTDVFIRYIENLPRIDARRIAVPEVQGHNIR